MSPAVNNCSRFRLIVAPRDEIQCPNFNKSFCDFSIANRTLRTVFNVTLNFSVFDLLYTKCNEVLILDIRSVVPAVLYLVYKKAKYLKVLKIIISLDRRDYNIRERIPFSAILSTV